ncbi:peptidase domain-containing ABC transporter [Larkinella humicola]|uniref:Peptidase domain-containing ABC transporter n=1 Tax=Larkinella humicola TaxID=2607654 RepID=A0A5N1JNI0_9BACT|nr:peptidase domain-containing ABC transporter [Larkinella humicola]KAA9355156.1 peptidase domain-containing ABC transporter [Larkinella humicola]
MTTPQRITKTFTRQLDQTDCGVACLLSLVRYHGGDVSRERLRELSGTSIQGTTMLGLCQAATGLGLEAEGFEADGVQNLHDLTMPVVLHVVLEERLQHYVVFYGIIPASLPKGQTNPSSGVKYRIGDPGKGVVEMTADELETIWQSRALLQVTPTESFVQTGQQQKGQWQWFQALIRDDVPLLGIAAGLGILIAVLGLSMALFSQRLIDDILPKQNTEKLTWGLILLAVLLLARSGLNYLRSFFLLRQSREFNIRIADSFFRDLLRLPKAFFDTRKTGDLVARLNDTRRIQSTISFLTGSVVIDTLVVLITAGVLFRYSWQIGLLSLLSFPLYGWLVWRFNGLIITGQREVMASYARTESHFIDSMSGIGAIKAGRREEFFARITQSVYQLFQHKLYDLGLLGNRYGILSEVFGVGLLMALISVTAFMVLQKHLLLGEMMAIISMASTLISSVSKLSTTNIQLQEARVAFDRMREFTELPKETMGEMTPADQHLTSLTVENLSFRFPGRPALLKNVSFTVRRGEIVGIVGETGSGKSMLLQLLQKFYEPETGQLNVGVTSLNWAEKTVSWSDISLEDWRNRIACVPQSIKIFNGTLLDNICLGNVLEEGEAVVHFCQKHGFDRYFESLPQSYFTLVGEEGINLSGGQQQLVGLARALYRRPQLLLLDEATSALDRQTEQFVLELLNRLRPQLATVLVTHRSQSVQLTDRVYGLTTGCLEEQKAVAVFS